MRARRLWMAVATIVSCLALGLGHGVRAGEAQQQNPLFLQAQAIAAQVASSSMSDELKTGFAERIGVLAAEQQNLWSLAGQVDGGQCADACLDDYNSRVVAWQNGLVAFASEASAALPQGSAQVTMENHTGQTLDLYIDKQQHCRALMNLMCTAQTASGFHVLVAAAGDSVVGSETVTLQAGESYTFAVR
jgi:hypothetical protein